MGHGADIEHVRMRAGRRGARKLRERLKLDPKALLESFRISASGPASMHRLRCLRSPHVAHGRCTALDHSQFRDMTKWSRIRDHPFFDHWYLC